MENLQLFGLVEWWFGEAPCMDEEPKTQRGFSFTYT